MLLRRTAPRLARTASLLLGAAVAAALATGCSALPARPDRVDGGPLTMWSHGGTDAEQAVLEQEVARWNASGAGTPVRLRVIPEGDYGQTVQVAITSRRLPDILEVDGPLVPSYAYQGALAPLDDRLPADVVEGVLPSLVTQGTYEGRLYAVGAFESGLALYADRSRLEAVGARVPTGADDAWTAAELDDVLRRLAASDPDGRVLDLKLNYGVGEWLTYGFSPLLWSAGTDLVDRETLRAEGVLDSPAAVAALTTFASWQPYVDPNPGDSAFVERDVALSWVGHWAYEDYAAALGDDLVLLPLPDLGRGSRSSQGSWAWALGDGPRTTESAAVLQHLLGDDAVARTTAANGAVPGTWAALGADPRFDDDGPLAAFATALTETCGNDPSPGTCVGVTRPQTPGYPTLSHAFARAVDAVVHGADPRSALEEAAATVDEDTAANDGYRDPGHAAAAAWGRAPRPGTSGRGRGR